MQKEFFAFCLLFCVTAFAKDNECLRNQPIDSAAFITVTSEAHIKLAKSATNFLKKVYLVPYRENLGKSSLTHSQLIHYKGDDRFQTLFKQKPQAIYAMRFNFVKELLAIPPCDRPELIILASKTPLDEYNALPLDVKNQLSNIHFVSLWYSRLSNITYFHGVGESISRTLNILNINKNQPLLLLGYGKTGKGIANYLKKAGYQVSVYDTDPTERVIASYDGFHVGSFETLAKNTEVVIDATGGQSPSITPVTAQYFKAPEVYILASSTIDSDVTIPNGYKNKNGTLFKIDESHGHANIYHVDGSNLKNLLPDLNTYVYLIKHYPNDLKMLKPIEGSNVLRLSKELEALISKEILNKKHS